MGYKFLDFGQSINDELEKSLIEVLRSGFWSTGPQSKLLEDTFSQKYKRYCVTTSSGGTALQTVSLLFPEIKRIAVQTNTYFAKHVYDIAEENARGQCTAGHSCKVCITFLDRLLLLSYQLSNLIQSLKSSSKDLLQQYVDLKSEMDEGFDIINGRIIT